jgi:hypothetical protein
MKPEADRDKQDGPARTGDLDEKRLALDWARLRADRQKTAIELALRRKELAHTTGRNYFEVLANPFMLAIVGGFITLMTGIVTSHYSTTNNLETERKKAELAASAANQALQAELIKKFVESPRTETVRENLRFLIDAGLLPDYAKGIKQYLADNPSAAPQVGGTIDFSPGGELVSSVIAGRIQDNIGRFRTFLQSKGFNNLDERVQAFIFSKDHPPPAGTGVSGDARNSFYLENTLYIHKDLSEDISVALREYAHHALSKSIPRDFTQTEVESALADYLPATFLNSPLVGIKSPMPRSMDNSATYDPHDLPDMWFARGIVWAGAIWACRQRIDRQRVDDQIRPAWLQANTPPIEAKLIAARFGAALTNAPSPLGECFTEEIARRGLPRSTSQ